MNMTLVSIVNLVLSVLATPKAQDEVLDFLEDLVQRSETTVDDRTILPIIDAYRLMRGIPDNLNDR